MVLGGVGQFPMSEVFLYDRLRQREGGARRVWRRDESKRFKDFDLQIKDRIWS